MNPQELKDFISRIDAVYCASKNPLEKILIEQIVGASYRLMDLYCPDEEMPSAITYPEGYIEEDRLPLHSVAKIPYAFDA